VLGAVTFHSLSTTAGLPDGADEGAAADAAGVDGCDDGGAAESDFAGRSADGAWTAALVHAERTMATKTDRAASRERFMMFTRQVSKRFSRQDQFDRSRHRVRRRTFTSSWWRLESTPVADGHER